MKKRFLSLLLVLVLIMSLMPAALAVNADDAQPKTISGHLPAAYGHG